MEAFKITATPKQQEAHKALKENTIVLFGGAIRGSKSHWGCMEIISLCFQYPRSRWLMCRESWGNIKTKLLITFTENFLNNGFNDYVESFNKDTFVLTWNNGSQIVFMAESYDSDKELNKFRGLEINGAFIDEVNEIHEETFNKIIERSGSWFHSPGCPTKILMSCNPTNNWVKTRFHDHWKKGTLPEGISYIPAKITDNPYVPKEYIESLKMLPRYQYMVFVEGDWDVQLKTGGEFYKCFELDKHVGQTKYDPELPIHISWDDNVNPYLPCGIFQIQGKEIRMIDEIALESPRNTIKDVCNEIKRLYPAHKSGLFIYGDATANKEDTKIEKGYNFYRLIVEALAQYKPSNRVLKSNPSISMRGNWINTLLENNLGGIKVIIGEHCFNTINDLILIKEAPDGTKMKTMENNPVTGKNYQKIGHFSDCFVGETSIITKNGNKRIDEITVGDYVLTRLGFKKVLKTYDKGERTVKTYRIGDRHITCTEEHLFWTKENGFHPVGQLLCKATFCIFDEKTNTCKETLLNIEDLSLQDIQRVSQGLKKYIIPEEQKSTESPKKLDYTFINTCVKLLKFQKEVVFTTLTRTLSIMKYQILSVKQCLSIRVTTCSLQFVKKYLVCALINLLGQKHQSGTGQKMAESGIVNKTKKTSTIEEQKKNVLSVVANLWDYIRLEITPNFAQKNAKTGLAQEGIGLLENGISIENVQIVKNHSAFTNGVNKNSVQDRVQRVYDIQVEDEHEFFANGILVHNCFDYIMVSAFASDYEDYQRGGKSVKISTIKTAPSKNSY